MAKQINLIVNSCGECTPYMDKKLKECKHPDNEFYRIHIENSEIIHPDCPLEDVKEERNICIRCIYCNYQDNTQLFCDAFKEKITKVIDCSCFKAK